ncbi:MAG: G5 domain-containing protein [Ruminococcus sp.]|nr:G5 domain-containing protein [Ruminococcus sp.]
MTKTNKILKVATTLLMCLLMLSLVACGKPVTVNINDLGVAEAKVVEATTSMTVAEVLEAAKITLSEKDEVTPAKDEKITEDTKEITIKRYAKVNIIKGDETKTVELVGGTVKDALVKAGITLAENELTDVDENAYLTDGMEINVLQKMNVTLTADGETKEISTVTKTVEEFLNVQKITLDEDDELSVKLTDAITDGMKIVVKRVEYKEETRTETIDFSTKERFNDAQPEGTSEVIQQGVEGSKEVTYKVKYVDSKETSKEVISEKVTKEPVDKIISYGSKVTSSPSSGSDSGSNSSSGGKTVVSKQPVYDCDGSGHGYYVITYSDGSVEYQEF